MVWDDYVGHAEQLALIRGVVGQGRLAHTYLFLGPPGVGKRTFAVKFAQSLLCERQPESAVAGCGTCGGCRQVAVRTHPDFFLVQRPEGKREHLLEQFLGPDERRGREGLCYDLSRTPMAGKRKIAIIDEADLLNEESANALLKTLEEPPPMSLIMLVAANADAILPTIRSRCQVLRFGALAPKDVAELLLRNEMVDTPERAAEVAVLSEGSLTRAAEALDPRLLAQRKSLFEGLATQNFSSVALAAKVMEELESLTGETAAQRQLAAWIVRFCVDFYRSSLFTLSGSPATGAESPAVQKFCSRLGDHPDQLEALGLLMERAIESQTHLDQNAGVALCLETLFNDLGRMHRTLLGA